MEISNRVWITAGAVLVYTIAFFSFFAVVGTGKGLPVLYEFSTTLGVLVILTLAAFFIAGEKFGFMTVGITLVATSLTWIFAPVLPYVWAFNYQILADAVKAVFGLDGLVYAPQDKIVFLMNAVWFFVFCLGCALIRASKIWKDKLSLATGKDPDRANSSIFGDAQWGVWSKMRPEVGPPKGRTGIILGEDYDPRKRRVKYYDLKDKKTWGKGGTAPLIEMSLAYDDGHSQIIAGSGAGKTAAYIIPTCKNYTGAILAVDPDREAIMASEDDRRDKMGRCVREVSFEEGCCVDLLKILKPYYDKDVLVFRDIAKSMLMLESKAHFDKFYFDQGVNLIAALFEYYACETSIHPFDGLSEIFAQTSEDLKKSLSKISAASERPNIKSVTNQIASSGTDFFTWFLPSTVKSLNWLFHENVRQSLMADPEGATSAVDKNTDIFICVPTARLDDMGSYTKLILGVVAIHMERREVKDHQRLYIIDEAVRLGYVPLFERIRDAGRKFGIHLMVIYQNQIQLRDCYGQDAEKAWASVSVRAYSAVQDYNEASEIANSVGNYTAEVEGSSSSQRQSPLSIMPNSLDSSEQKSLQRASLIHADQIRKLPRDTQILLFRGQNPLICGKAMAMRRKEWAGYKTVHVDWDKAHIASVKKKSQYHVK